MSGNLARRRMTKFMPADFKLIEARQPPLKDMYDEWLARIICYAFSVPASPFVSQVNRATSETLRLQATQEGLVPLKAWIKNALDHVIQSCMNEPGLEFVWVGDDAIDPLQQALGAEGGKPPGAPAGLGKFNPNHDEQGRFTTADNAGGPSAATPLKPRPKGVQVASLANIVSDIGDAQTAAEVAQITEPGPPPPLPETPPAAEGSATPLAGTPPDAAPANQSEETDSSSTTAPRFANDRLLNKHFLKHGTDFGAEAASGYQEQAASFLTDQNNPDILEFTRTRGDVVRFNPLTDEFGVFSSDGRIRTYYRPDPTDHGFPTNLDYFYSQEGQSDE